MIGVVTSLPSDHACGIDKSLYLQLLRGYRGYVHPQKCLSRHRLFISNRIQQILQERQMLLWYVTFSLTGIHSMQDGTATTWQEGQKD